MIYGGIDAGGTSSKCILVNGKGDLLAHVKTGPANYQVVGLTATVQEINIALEQACKIAACQQIDVLGIGLAGAGSQNDIEKIKEKLLPIPNVKQSYLTNDAEIAVHGAHAGEPGIVLIAGTGSIVYGLTEEENIVRTGGWGPLLGDEGSGFWIGLQALQKIIKTAEGRGPNTKLLKSVLNALNINEIRGLVDYIYQERLPRQEVAALAPLVIEKMIQGDQVAGEIINSGLEELALSVKIVADEMGYNKKNPPEVAVTGGLFANQHYFRFFARIMKDNYQLKISRPRLQAVEGAVLYGAKKAGNLEELLETGLFKLSQ